MVMIVITERFKIVDLLETLAIADGDECKYYQNSNDNFIKLCDLLNELSEENEQLKQKNKKLNHFVDEYRYITELEEENQILKNEIVAIVGLCIKMEDYINDIKIIANNRGGKND